MACLACFALGSCGGGDRGNATSGALTLSGLVVDLASISSLGERGYMVELGDIDGDGDLDLFLGSSLYRNNDGLFELAANSLPGTAGQAAFGDVDGDGDLDLFALQSTSRLWRNDGSGHFTDVTSTHIVTNHNGAMRVALGDVDGDGDLDAFVSSTLQDRLYRNDGAGVFTDATATWLPQATTNAFLLADFDGDGDPDLLSANRFLRNTGQTFAVEPLAVEPILLSFLGAMACGDLDGDGDLDVVGTGFGTSEANALLLNDGNGHFANVSTNLPQGSNGDENMSVAIADVDGDGDLDVAIASQGKLALNDGSANFSLAPANHLASLWCYSTIRFGDMDADGDPDLVLGSAPNLDCLSPNKPTWLRNDGQGRFRDATIRRRGPRVGFPADVDGDLDLDVLLGNGDVDVNDGTGAFAAATGRFSPPPTDLRLIAVGDIDGNGSPDAVFGTYAAPSGTEQNRVYANDGSGSFTSLPHPLVGETICGTLGDVDGDGDLDLVLGRAGQSSAARQNMLLLNDGQGGFFDVTATRMPIDAEQTTDVELADVDRDGDLDLVLAGNDGTQINGRIRLYSNDGIGRFTDVTGVHLPATPCMVTRVTLVDLEGDQDLDILITASNGPCWYRNTGNGIYDDASANLPFCGASHTFQAASDLDGDGDVDLAIGSFPGVSFFLQVAPGVFHEDSASLIPPTPSSSFFPIIPTIQAMDVDGDGDLEWAGKVNLARHLLAPNGAGAGRPWRLLLFARPGSLAAPQVAHIYVGFTLAAPPIALPPLGVFALDPVSAVTLAPITIPAPSGTASVLQIPLEPTLVGQILHAQALIHDPTTSVGGFTNRISERISL